MKNVCSDAIKRLRVKKSVLTSEICVHCVSTKTGHDLQSKSKHTFQEQSGFVWRTTKIYK